MKLLLLLCLISASVVLGKPLDEADAQGSNDLNIRDAIEDEKLQMLQNLKKATKKHNRKMKNLPRRQNRKRIHKNLLKSQNQKHLIMTKNNKTLRMKKPKNCQEPVEEPEPEEPEASGDEENAEEDRPEPPRPPKHPHHGHGKPHHGHEPPRAGPGHHHRPGGPRPVIY
ncbi:hypothetical protein pipiens_002048 [Culex pipiens pipiens]|uniref:Uncharacterized protein n=1 Tax=Culex pipiens pipiens TaxID=38569 RepID=A0ABD1DQF2_CULPP